MVRETDEELRCLAVKMGIIDEEADKQDMSNLTSLLGKRKHKKINNAKDNSKI